MGLALSLTSPPDPVCRYESEGRARRTIPAQQLWRRVIESQIETGTPYMLYKVRVGCTLCGVRYEGTPYAHARAASTRVHICLWLVRYRMGRMPSPTCSI